MITSRSIKKHMNLNTLFDHTQIKLYIFLIIVLKIYYLIITFPLFSFMCVSNFLLANNNYSLLSYYRLLEYINKILRDM